jgi:MtN3 and saliva related transmembrane protein
MIDAESLGLAAAAISTSGWFPQMYKTITTKDTTGISALSYGFLGISVCLWFSYGIMIDSLPVIASNLCGAACIGTVMFYKWRYKK